MLRNGQLLAVDVVPADVPSDLITVERYPEIAAREVVLSRLVQPGDAAWEQDSSRISCPKPGCGKRFHLLNRRHHCRFLALFFLFCILCWMLNCVYCTGFAGMSCAAIVLLCLSVWAATSMYVVVWSAKAVSAVIRFERMIAEAIQDCCLYYSLFAFLSMY